LAHKKFVLKLKNLNSYQTRISAGLKMTTMNFLTTIFLAATLLFGLAEATYITTTALAPSHANFPFSLTPTLAQHKKQVTLIASYVG
jgi:hypothetical protein